VERSTPHFLSVVAAVPVTGVCSGSSAASIAVTRLVVVAAVSHAVMDMPSKGGAALYRTQGQALTIAEAALVIAAAVGHAVMDMPSGNLTALYRTERETLAVAYAVCVVIAAVGHAIVGVPSRDLAALHRADSDLGLDIPAAMMAVAVGHGRDHQRQRHHAGKQQGQRPSPDRFAGCGKIVVHGKRLLYEMKIT